MFKHRLIPILAVSLLTACGSFEVQDSAPRHIPVDPHNVSNAVPRVEPRSRHGNPVRYEQFGETYTLRKRCTGYRDRGDASWYGTKFHGQRTSSGEVYDMFAMSAAHKTLPIPCYARVTNLDNGKSVIVRINDRGPFHEGRIIDLSYVAAAKLGMLKKGTARVEVTTIDPRNPGQVATAETANDEAEPLADTPLPATEQASETQDTESLTAAADNPPADGTSSINNRLYLQVGAYAQRQNAEKIRAELILLLSERITIKPRTNGLFKLWIGPLANVEQADRVSATLSGHGYSQTHVIID